MVDEKQFSLRVEQVASLLGLNDIEKCHTPRELNNHWDEVSDCFLIRSDNLSAMAALIAKNQTVDFCYIDPPYNTGQEFVYSDNKTRWSSGMWGRHHDWMAFMLPRLVSAHFLLKNTGVIAISIDDYEYANLKILMDVIFGSDQYIATLVICRSKNGKGSKQNVAVNHEYVLLYGKTNESLISGLAEGEDKTYEKADEFGEYTVDGLFRKKGDASLREDRPNMYYPLYYSEDGRVYTENTKEGLAMVLPVDSKGIARRWLWGIEKATAESWKLYASKKGVIYVKNYKTAGKKTKLRSILDSSDYLTDRATTELKAIFGDKIFETPKPVSLIRDLIDCCAPSHATILDFFAGTGTTAEAAWELNKRDGTKRKVILIEQNQPIKHTHIAHKNGFRHTAEIAEFRLKSICERDKDYRFSVSHVNSDAQAEN